MTQQKYIYSQLRHVNVLVIQQLNHSPALVIKVIKVNTKVLSFWVIEHAFGLRRIQTRQDKQKAQTVDSTHIQKDQHIQLIK